MIMKLIVLCLSLMSSGVSQAVEVAVVSVVPPPRLDYWNQDGVEPYNNCYNYSTNRQTDSFAQPGEASGKKYTSLTCAAVLAAASADLGLVRTAPFPLNGATNQGTLIALVIDPGNDFHWYRRDANGKWTHKPGAWPATNLDNSEREIFSPEKADRGTYSAFCGYFRVKSYAYQRNLQNGGYVRIGTMRRLPFLPSVSTPPTLHLASALDFSAVEAPSEVEVLAYSGRPNPKISLSEALSDPAIAQLLAAKSNQYGGMIQLALHQLATPHLGASGVVIRDHQGLVFAPGTVVYFPVTAQAVADPHHPEALGNALQNLVISKQLN